MPGSAQCIANLKIIQSRLESTSRKTVKNWVIETYGKSKEMCPVKTGKLRRSEYFKIQKNTLTEFFMRIGYTTVYALKQHETPWYHHPVGQWKFLSTPFNRRTPKLLTDLEAVWKREI